MKITIKVVPKASSQRLIIDKSGVLKCYLNSPPEDGKANKELIKLLSKKIKTTQRDIIIVQGLTSRIKILEIAGFDSRDEVLHALGLQVQSSFF